MVDPNTPPGTIPGNTDPPPSVLWEYVGVLRRRVWVILPLVIIAGTIGLIKAFQTPRIYRATTQLLVEKQAPDVTKFDRDMQGDAYDPDFYSTQTELIRSRAVMTNALAQSGIAKLFTGGEQGAKQSSLAGELKRTLLAALGAEPAPPPEPWSLLREKLVIVHVKDSHFMKVEALDGDPHAAAAIANATARAYQEYHRARKIDQLGEAYAGLARERDKEEAALLEAEEELQAFRERAHNPTVSPGEDQPAITRLEKLNEQLTDVQLKRIELTSQIGVMKQALDSDLDVGDAVHERLFSIPVIQTDLSLSDTRKALADAEKDLSVLGQTYGLRHPRYQAAETNVVLLRRQFKSALREIISSHDNRLEMLTNQETEIQKTYEDQKLAALDLAKETFEYTRLKNAVDRHRDLFDNLVERMREVDLSSNLTQTNIQIIEEASPPQTPINQGRLRKVLAAAFFGFLLGAMLALMFETLDDTIKTPEDIKSRLRAPFLGFIPAVEEETEKNPKDKDAGPKPEGASAAEGEAEPEEPTTPAVERAKTLCRDVVKLARQRLGVYFPQIAPPQDTQENRGTPEERAYRGTLVLSEPMSSVAEAYRGIRASLFYSIPAEEIKTLSLTSSRPQEGKTTTSCNLALSIAQTGKRVLLIDGDLHRPSVHTVLNMRNHVGLTSVLVGQATRQAALQKLVHNGKPVEHLDVLTAGPATPNPSELLGSTVMRDLLAEVRRSYDWVIVDTPPILFVSDAGILSTMCDGVVIVVRSGNSTRSLLNRTTEQLANLKARIVGSILNGVTVARMGRYYSSYYSYGYARYAKEYQRTYYSGQESEATAESTEAAARRREPPRGVPAREIAHAQAAAPAAPAPETSPAPTHAMVDRTAEREWQARAQRAEQDIQRLRTDRESDHRAAERLREDLEAARQRVRDLETRELQTAGAAQALASAEAQAHDLRVQIDGLRRELDAERGARRHAEQRGIELENRLTQPIASPDVDGIRTQLADARRELEAQFAARAERDALVRRTEESVLALQQRLKTADSAVNDLKRQLADAHAQQERLAADYALKEIEANRKLDELAARLDDARAESKPKAEAPTPEAARDMLQRARAYLMTGNFAEARGVIRPLVESTTEEDEAWEILLDTLLLGHDQEELTAWLRRFPELPRVPAQVPALAEGHRALLQRNADLALQYYETAVRDRRFGRVAQEGILRAAIQKNDIDLARATLRKLNYSSRDGAYAHYAEAFLHALDGKSSRAERALRKSLELRKTPEALTDLAWLLSERKSNDEAEQLARAATALYPIIPAGWETLGVVLLRNQRPAEAERALQRAHTLAPGNVGTMLNLAELHLQQGNTSAAMEFGARLAGMQGRLSPEEQTRLGALRNKLSAR